MAEECRVEVLFLGDELLLGLRVNEHLRFLGQELSTRGLPITASHELGDELQEIVRAVTSAWARADILITTGGLGPTGDDCTREAVAEALGTELVHDAPTEARLREFFARQGKTLTENNLQQCKLLRGAIRLENPNGTAPGQWFERDGKLLIMLPGPPGELQPLFLETVVPKLRDKAWIREKAPSIQLRTSGLGESLLADRVVRVLGDFPEEVKAAFCAEEGFVDLRLSPANPDVPAGRIQEAAEACESMLGPDFVGYGDADPARLILKHLRTLRQRLAVAESCTGGLLASRFTDIPGSSKVFLGGVTCYRNEVKESLLDIPSSLIEQHGAVSPEVAVAMATGVAELLGADYALSVTGFAGPGGGNVPSGTLYLGYVSPFGVWCRKVVGSGTRLSVKNHGVNASLDFMRRKLQKYAMHDLLESMSRT